MKRMSKIFIPVFLALSILMAAVPAFADTTATAPNDKATILKELGLYAGTNADKFEPDLSSSLSREQGITLLIRLMGFESSANAMSEAEIQAALSMYSDTASVSDWAKKYVACAVKNNLVAGFPDKTLQVKAQLTGNQYATLLLKGAGYTVTADTFSQAATSFAAKTNIPLLEVQSMGSAPILRSNAVDMSFGALGVVVNGSSETLIQKLVANGVVKESDAEKTGLQVVASPVLPPYYPPANTNVYFSGIETVATQTFSTTQLLLIFTVDPTTLSINDITVTGATKGTLSGTGLTRTLTISDISVPDNSAITVSISNPSGFSISPSSATALVVHKPAFTSGTPATYNNTLTISAGASLDVTVVYNWYSSTDAVWDAGDSQVHTGTTYKPTSNDVGKYLIVRAVLSSDGTTVVSTVVTSAPVA